MLIDRVKKSLQSDGASINAIYSLGNKGINALVPLLLLPLCNNLFGVEAFGSMVFLQSIVGLVITFSDYGFSITGLKTASINAESNLAINKLFSEVSFIKVLLLAIGGIILYFYLNYQQKLSSTNNFLLFLFVFFSLALQSLLPYWLYQGLKKNRTIAVINLFSKLLFLLLIVAIVLKSNHIFSVVLAESISYLFALAICVYLLTKQYQFKFNLPSYNSLKYQFKNGFNIFLIILIYWAINGGSILVVEKNVSPFELGFYSIFLRFAYFLFAIFQPIILTLIPYFTEKFTISFEQGIGYYKKIFFYYFIAVAIIIIVLSLCLKFIVGIAFSNEILNFYTTNKIIPFSLIIWIFLLLMNNFTANAVLLSNHKEKLFRNTQILNGITVVILFFLLIPKYGTLGAGISMICGELIFTTLIFTNSYKHLFIRNFK